MFIISYLLKDIENRGWLAGIIYVLCKELESTWLPGIMVS
jgi:hypothetical protein